MDAGLTDRDFASIVLGSLDCEAQLAAIRGLLRRHRETEAELSNTIQTIDLQARQLGGRANARAVDEWLEHMHASVFQGAAHSMAAVGMIAPLIETMFKSAFSGIRKLFTQQGNPLVQSIRPTMRDGQRWDCQFCSGGRKNLVRGVLELVEALGLAAELPGDLNRSVGWSSSTSRSRRRTTGPSRSPISMPARTR